MAASAQDAHFQPIYKARFRVLLPLLDADGDPVAGATGLDSERSIDCGTFADCTNEATEIATSSGLYYLDLDSAEMTAKSLAIIVKTTSVGAKTTPIVLYPKRMTVIRTGTAQAGAATTITLDSGASAVDTAYAGCYVNITNNSPANALGQARRAISYVGATKVLTVEAAWGTNPSSASTFEILAPEAVTVAAWGGVTVADTNTAGYPVVTVKDGTGTGEIDTASGKVSIVAADITSIQSGLATSAALATVQSDTDDIQTRLPAALVSGRIDASVGAMAADVITAAAIATDAIGSAELAATAVTEIQSGLASSAAIAAVQSDTDDIQTRLPAALVGGRMDSSVGALGTDSVNANALATSAVTEIWSAASRTLTTAAVPLTTQPTAGAITQLRGDSWSIGFTGLGSLTGASQIWFTVKTATTDADTAAIVQISQTVGLVRLNGSAGTAIQGSIVVVDAPTGAITVNLDEVASAQVAPGSYTYDVQSLNAGTVTTHTLGTLTVTADVTRATS